MTRLTCVFLVLLRLAIGWHFLFEGAEKVTTYFFTTKPAWSSEAYLRESCAPGLLGSLFRSLAGDAVLDRYEMTPIPEGVDPASSPAYKQLPRALDKDWQGFFDRFVEYYSLTPEQRSQAEAVLAQHKEQTALWLRGKGEHNTTAVTRKPPAGNADLPLDQTAPERIQEYQAKVTLVQRLEAEMNQLGSGVKKRLDEAKAEVRKERKQLQTDLAARSAALADGLYTVLTDEQRASHRELEPLDAARVRLAGLSEEQRTEAAELTEPVSRTLQDYFQWPPLAWTMGPGIHEPVGRHVLDYGKLDWADFLTRWGLVVMGACLLLGLFTRTACVAGALFLCLLWLSMPPLLGAPEAVRMEGRFLVNKNLIEMLALLTLATTASGKWLGLDGLLQYLNPRRWRRARRASYRLSKVPPAVASTTPS
jgi:uncharacterized membrane protein YphA (DoxX/SURF4 family)